MIFYKNCWNHGILEIDDIVPRPKRFFRYFTESVSLSSYELIIQVRTSLACSEVAREESELRYLCNDKQRNRIGLSKVINN